MATICKRGTWFRKLIWRMWILTLMGVPGDVMAQPVEGRYKQYFERYVDDRSIWEKTLNWMGITSEAVGRSVALVAGVSTYPNLSSDRQLKPAAVDVEKVVAYLKEVELFDEIVVLRDEHVNQDNLRYFLQSYFPERLDKIPRSRFLLAYSGHGFTEEGFEAGYLLESGARTMADKSNSISMSVLRTWIDEIVDRAHQTLVLINACHSGAFLQRSFGEVRALPTDPGAHAITAGGTGELTWHDARVGPGSIFFEKFLAGVEEGRADSWPPGGDGVVTVDELILYLKREVILETGDAQKPRAGDISKHGGSAGGVFFLNRNRKPTEQSARGLSDRSAWFGEGVPEPSRANLESDASAAKEALDEAKVAAEQVPYQDYALPDYEAARTREEQGNQHFERGEYREAKDAYLQAEQFFRQAREKTQAKQASVFSIMRSITPAFEASLKDGDIDRLGSLFQGLRDSERKTFELLSRNNDIQNVTLTWKDNWQIDDEHVQVDAVAEIDYRNRRNERERLYHTYTWTIQRTDDQWLITDYVVKERALEK